MCIIVDANAIEDVNGPSEHGAPVLKWITDGKGGLVVGGRVYRELAQSKKIRSLMVTLNRVGRLHQFGDEKLDEVSEKHKLEERCCSNDSHVIAVAIASGCRLIFSKDRELHKDAKNRDILNPIASIYQTKDHHDLLTECKCG